MLENRVLTNKLEGFLSRLHSTISEEEVGQLVAVESRSQERIREVQVEAKRLVQIVLAGTPLSDEDIARLNQEAAKSCPYYDPSEGRQTYFVEEGELIDLWFPMFANYWGSGRMRECQYDKCRRIYVARHLAGKPSKYCSEDCYYRAVRLPHIRAKRDQERKRRKSP